MPARFMFFVWHHRELSTDKSRGAWDGVGGELSGRRRWPVARCWPAALLFYDHSLFDAPPSRRYDATPSSTTTAPTRPVACYASYFIASSTLAQSERKRYHRINNSCTSLRIFSVESFYVFVDFRSIYNASAWDVLKSAHSSCCYKV